MRHLTLLLLMVVSLGACTASPAVEQSKDTDDGRAREAVETFAGLLQTGIRYDFEVFAPSALRDRADVVVVGKIVDVVEGRVLPMGRSGLHANLVVEVDRTLRGSPDPTVYVEVLLPSVVSVEGIREAAPTDRVLLFLMDRTNVAPVSGEIGRPKGAPIYAPYPQGIIIEAGSGWVAGLVHNGELSSSWLKYESFEALLSAVEN